MILMNDVVLLLYKIILELKKALIFIFKDSPLFYII